jgi:polyferredoxin
MTSSLLRKLRILFSSIVLICFLFVFADFRSAVPEKYINYLLYLQFVPSVLKYINLMTMAAGGFMIVLLLTLLTGRTYCSFLCPLGIGQDLFSRIGGRIKRKFRRFGYKKPHTIVRYSLLAITLGTAIFFGLYLVTLLDPYSIFGRFMTYLGEPVILLINNFLTWVLGKFDIYTLHHIDIRGFNPMTYAVPVAFFLLVGAMSFLKGRLYCNMICPVGTLLGLISKVSIFRIKFSESKCTRCGRCSVRCKSSCIDFLNYNIDVSRCVNCFNCIDVCPEKALSYSFIASKEKPSQTDEGRRKFVAGSLLMLLGINSSARSQDQKGVPVPHKESTVKEPRNFPVCPPGAGSMEDFAERCTACSLCINACPNNVLQPAVMQYGIAGFMQPVMDYHRSFCTFNCTVCTDICPTNALKPLLLEAKKLTQIGKVFFIKDNCIVKTEKTACGACSESCPTKAVYMVPYEGNLVIPETNQDICIGCGHCEYACPVTPYKAIFVDGNSVHLAAAKPEIKEAEITSPEEFPF